MADKYLTPKCTRIKVNVGGTVFETYLSTLTKVNDGVLSATVGKCWRNGEELFIDRNPLLFAKVLDYLRDEKDFVPPSDDDAREALRREAEFYNLPELVERCLPEEFHGGDYVRWKESAIEPYWKVFATAIGEPTCVFCRKYPGKCLLLNLRTQDGTLRDEYCLPLKYQMRFMKGKVIHGGAPDWNSLYVIWDPPYDQYPMHIPASALRLMK